MPIYEFVCHDCGTNFEKRVSYAQTTTPVCATCTSDNVQRQISALAIHFKGKGWYTTDSKKANPANGSSQTDSKPSVSTPEPVAT